MREVVIVEAVRTPLGKRNGGLSAMHSIDLLGAVQSELFTRSGVDPSEVGQVVGGCVGQVGMQTMNVTRKSACGDYWSGWHRGRLGGTPPGAKWLG